MSATSSSRLDRGRSEITRHQFHRSDLSTFVPEEPVQVIQEDREPKFDLRPKRAFRGRAFVCFGNIVPTLFGTSIFPLAPKQEKMYYNVATETSIDHFDGELDQSFLDDIRTFMQPVLDSMAPECQKSDFFLTRRDNKSFVSQWATKFPYASNRILEFNAHHKEPPSIERNAGSHYTPERYDQRITCQEPVLMSGISRSHGGLKTNKVEVVNVAMVVVK